VAIIRNYFALGHAFQEKSHAVQRLLNRFFSRTEKAKRVLKKAGPHEDAPIPPEAAEKESPKEKPKGHGRNGAAAYTGAHKVCVPQPGYQAGDPARSVPKASSTPWGSRGWKSGSLAGRLWKPPSMSWTNGAVISAARSLPPPFPKKREPKNTMRPPAPWWPCSSTGRPSFPSPGEPAGQPRVPLPASTQWELAENTADQIHPVYREMIRQAAQGEIFQNDDTPMKILANLKNNDPQDPSSRKGSFTTGVLAVREEHRMALFFTGPQHAGRTWKNSWNKGPRILALPSRCATP